MLRGGENQNDADDGTSTSAQEYEQRAINWWKWQSYVGCASYLAFVGPFHLWYVMKCRAYLSEGEKRNQIGSRTVGGAAHGGNMSSV